MSQAQDLLKAISYSAGVTEVSTTPVNDILVIDAEGRITHVPNTEVLLGVETDHDVERKYFKCPRIVGDNIDLSELQLIVKYQNAEGRKDKYPVADVTVNGDYIEFSWKLSDKVLAAKGTVLFAIQAVSTEYNGTIKNRWNTTLASGTVLETLNVDDLDDYEEEQARDILTQLLQLMDDEYNNSIQNIQAEAARQLGNIQAVGATQVQAVTNKGAEVLASIPDDYTNTHKLAEEAARTKSDAIVETVQNETIVLTDASNDYLRNLRVFGKTTQTANPTPDNPQELVSIENPKVGLFGGNLIDIYNMSTNTNTSLEISDDGYTITAIGGGSSGYTSSTVNLNVEMLAGKTVIFKADSIESTAKNAPAQLNIYSKDKKDYEALTSTTLERIISIPSDAYSIMFCVYTNNTDAAFGNDNTTVVKGVGLYLTDIDWEAPVEYQSITCAHKLQGIPVTDESLSTYTDSNGQKWIADEIDFEREVYIQRVLTKNFDGAGEDTIELYAEREHVYGFLIRQPNMLKLAHNALCTHFNNITFGISTADEECFLCGAGSSQIYFLLNKERLTEYSVQAFKTWLNANPITTVYQLATPIEHELTAAEIEAYKALHTNKLVTTVLNDSGAMMEVAYNTDLKKYIQNCLAGDHTHSFNGLEDKPFYEIEGDAVVIIPNQSYEFSVYEDDNFQIYEYDITHNPSLALTIGDVYTVNFDGITYDNLTCYDDAGYAVIGSVYNDLANGTALVPFQIVDMEYNGKRMLGIITNNISSISHTMELIGEGVNVKTLDEKYIPDTIPRLVNKGNTGQFAVSNGQGGIEWVTLPLWQGGAY